MAVLASGTDDRHPSRDFVSEGLRKRVASRQLCRPGKRVWQQSQEVTPMPVVRLAVALDAGLPRLICQQQPPGDGFRSPRGHC
jgi:hypothetical protein